MVKGLGGILMDDEEQKLKELEQLEILKGLWKELDEDG